MFTLQKEEQTSATKDTAERMPAIPSEKGPIKSLMLLPNPLPPAMDSDESYDELNVAMDLGRVEREGPAVYK